MISDGLPFHPGRPASCVYVHVVSCMVVAFLNNFFLGKVCMQIYIHVGVHRTICTLLTNMDTMGIFIEVKSQIYSTCPRRYSKSVKLL